MSFKNEQTWLNAVNDGKTEEFHVKYDSAVEMVRSELGKKHPMYIDGAPEYSEEGEFPDVSPSDTRIVLGYFQKGTRDDARRAIAAAKVAFSEWGWTDYGERVEIFRQAAEIMRQKKFELAAIVTLENGKNRYEAAGDVDEAIDFMEYYSWQMKLNHGFTRQMGIALPRENTKSVLRPYGVWGVIPPFNFPAAITVGMSTGALITGNTVVLKPASDTPFTALKFYEIMVEAGLPKGILNYVTGPGSTVGSELVENRDVAGIAFTGSKEVGVAAYHRFSENSPRPFVAEMGGKNAVIVTSSADLEKAAEGVMKAAFGYGGQKCSATSRVYVESSVMKPFLERLVARTKEMRIGNPLSRDVFLGPLINESAHRKYRGLVEEARKSGQVLHGGRNLQDGELGHGYYVEPTIIAGLSGDHPFFREELFVPILTVTDFKNLDEAIKHVNNVEYGLTAGIFSNDKEEIQKFIDRVETGVIYANRSFGATTGAMVGAQPFVGWKSSGSTGRGAGGPYYLQQFMREKSISTYS